MWNLTQDDIRRAKDSLSLRRIATMARHAEEIKALDADLAEIETLERILDAFVRKYKGPPGKAADAAADEHRAESEWAAADLAGPNFKVVAENWGDARRFRTP